MAFGRQQGGSIYLDRSPFHLESPKRPRLSFLRGLSPVRVFLQFAAVLVGLVVLGSSLQLTLLADTIRSASAAVSEPSVGDDREDDGSGAGKATLENAMRSAGFNPESSEDMERWAKQTRAPQNPNSFDALFYRLFVPQYINRTPSGVSTVDSGRTAGCNAPEMGKGTVVYHNCDVPNISGEIVQDIVRFVFPSGAYGAAQESAKSIAPSFGLPTGVLPGNGQVPVNESSRSYKYTALELFGYNLNYTAYLGEWDYLKVFTQARAMSNFGVFDNLKLGGKAIIDGAVNAANSGVRGWTNGWNSAGLAGAIGGFFSGAFEGGTTGAVNTILDTSDLNVFEQKAWYRPDFGATTYGARSMNSTELSAESLRWMNSMMNHYEPNKAQIPADFPSRTPPPRPLEAISSCDVIADRDGNLTAWGQRTTPPGVLESDCKAEGDRLKAAFQAEINRETAAYNAQLEDDEPKRTPRQIATPSYSFDADGVQAQESIASWSATHSGHISSMKKYGWNCALPSEGSASARAGSIDAWYSCFSSNYDKNYETTLNAEKVKESNIYTDSVFGKFASVFAGWYSAQTQEANFNAAYNRFVCQDPRTGADIMDGARNARVYNMDGSLTGKCAAIRAPIQDGLFGNGYVQGQAAPEADTRRTEFSPMESIGTAIGNTAAGMSLQVSIFATQLSNTILGLAFTPVLDALGIRDVIVSLIESFRDSLFMPLVVVVIAFSAVTIFWRAVRSGAYAQAFGSFLYIVVAFLLGVVLLAKPAATLKFVDEAPVMVESTILTAMFGGGSTDDQLCTATGTVTRAGGQQIDNSRGFDPNSSIRMLMCENWRSFAFIPWVFGQWGTGYENLYANGYAPTGSKSLNNSNQDLVGNAGVNFGAGQVIHNWATYQLAVTSVGTSTTEDPSRATGVVNKNFYRIVDAQMGPNGGAGTDPTYAKSWSKFNGDTAAAMILGPIAAIMGAAVVISFTIVKLELVFVSMFLLVVLPFILLIGVHPTFGRQKLKAYGGTLAGLMIQRVFITILIGLLFKFMFSISASGASYLVIALVSIVIAAVFLAYRKELMGLIQRAMDSAAGSFAGGRFYNARNEIARHIPLSLRNFGSMKQQEARGLAFGAIAAVRHGQKPWEIPSTLKNIRESYQQRESAAQMVKGLGGNQKFHRVKDEIDRDLNSQFNRSAEFEAAREELLEHSGAEDSRFNKDGYLVKKVYQTENPDGLPVDEQGRVLDSRGKPIVLEEKVERTMLGRKKTLSKRAVRRSMVKQNVLNNKLRKLQEKKTQRLLKGEKRALHRMGYGNMDQLTGEDRVRAQAARAQIHLDLTRFSKMDGRTLDGDGNPLAVDRSGAHIEHAVEHTAEALERTIDAGVAAGRFAPNEQRVEAQKAAYSELAGLVAQAARDVDESLEITQTVRETADSIDRNLGVSDTVRDAKRGIDRLRGKTDFDDFTGR